MNRRKFLKATSLTALAIPFTDFTAVISQKQPNDLQMFTNGIDTVICKNIEEARLLVAQQYYGYDDASWPATFVTLRFDSKIWCYMLARSAASKQLPCNKFVKMKIPIYYDEVDGVDGWSELDPESEFMLYNGGYPEDVSITKKVKDWIAEHGPGYFASTEY
jgi:hypothetical protein